MSRGRFEQFLEDHRLVELPVSGAIQKRHSPTCSTLTQVVQLGGAVAELGAVAPAVDGDSKPRDSGERRALTAGWPGQRFSVLFGL
jgi:hypothetical protein